MYKQSTLSAQNTFTDWLDVYPGSANLSISGISGDTVTLQRSFDGGTTIFDVTTFAADAERVFDEPEGAKYRLGIKTGDYSAGTVICRLGQKP